jgi:hypothetical protein
MAPGRRGVNLHVDTQPIMEDLAAMPPEVLSALGRALSLASDKGLAYLGQTLEWAHLGPTDTLIEIRMRRWLRVTAMSDACDQLLDRLEHAEGRPWESIRRSLADARMRLLEQAIA